MPDSRRDRIETVTIPSGSFWMGSDDADSVIADSEGPVRPVRLPAFEIATTTVTNSQFARFVSETDYCSDAERYGWSFVFAGLLPSSVRRTARRPEGTPWWCAVDGATWYAPEGPGSAVTDRGSHPVVHVSWNDAQAYCDWAAMRLPNEAEWEYAARGGLERKRFPWGDELMPDGHFHCNIWQGSFPARNTAADGYRATAPADAFVPNGYGLYNTVGNVWEWCADSWTTDHATTSPTASSGADRVIRGGSYLCHDSYCNRYRVAARTHSTADTTTGHTGFRCARDIT